MKWLAQAYAQFPRAGGLTSGRKCRTIASRKHTILPRPVLRLGRDATPRRRIVLSHAANRFRDHQTPQDEDRDRDRPRRTMTGQTAHGVARTAEQPEQYGFPSPQPSTSLEQKYSSSCVQATRAFSVRQDKVRKTDSQRWPRFY
jgi:hypothetical protein